ncbi:hypothetical protein [uncultured Ilyobacter sp.]|uniref:hypothetical protein n=1 Tax=uncultured Ilyobacter sp. TaxID=544433 RepID=UPI0029C8CE08|nr:hypothetical protein [uncultured Ilyobacter sp.]
MEKIIEFFGKYGVITVPIIMFVVGVLIPKEKVFVIGSKAGKKLPKNISLQLAEYMNSFEQGLLDATYEGDKSIVSNNQVSEAVGKIKIDLGLEESSLKKKE